VVPPGPALQAASATTATAGSARTGRLQARQARTGGRPPVAADAPRRDDQLIAIPSLLSASRSRSPTGDLVDHDDYLVFAPALGRQESCLHIALETAQEPLGVDLWSEHGPHVTPHAIPA
jgi:hypothetical protein